MSGSDPSPQVPPAEPGGAHAPPGHAAPPAVTREQPGAAGPGADPGRRVPPGWAPPPPGWIEEPATLPPYPPAAPTLERPGSGLKLLLVASLALNLILFGITVAGLGQPLPTRIRASRASRGVAGGGVAGGHRSAMSRASPASAAMALGTFTGVGPQTTARFGIGGDGSWLLRWSYDCSTLFGGTGNFIVTEDAGRNAAGVNVNELGRGGRGATRVSGDRGSHFLSIDSECRWKVTVLGVP